MGIYTTKPIKEIGTEEFKRLLKKKNIIISSHAADHLSTKQRNIFKESELINIIRKEKPRKVYLQQNARFGAYYRKSDGYRKIIIELEGEKAVVVSFMNTIEIPKIKL
ncbi:MAG: hypothetical protein ABIB71_02945 [Candidatus Woesearchaeota archaeon]